MPFLSFGKYKTEDTSQLPYGAGLFKWTLSVFFLCLLFVSLFFFLFVSLSLLAISLSLSLSLSPSLSLFPHPIGAGSLNCITSFFQRCVTNPRTQSLEVFGAVQLRGWREWLAWILCTKISTHDLWRACRPVTSSNPAVNNTTIPVLMVLRPAIQGEFSYLTLIVS